MRCVEHMELSLRLFLPSSLEDIFDFTTVHLTVSKFSSSPDKVRQTQYLDFICVIRLGWLVCFLPEMLL